MDKTDEKYTLEKLGHSNAAVVQHAGEKIALPFFLPLTLKRVMKLALRYDQNAAKDMHRRGAKQTRSYTKGDGWFSFCNPPRGPPFDILPKTQTSSACVSLLRKCEARKSWSVIDDIFISFRCQLKHTKWANTEAANSFTNSTELICYTSLPFPPSRKSPVNTLESILFLFFLTYR